MFVFLVTQRDGFPCLGLTQNSTEVQWTITQKMRARPSYNMILRLSLSIQIVPTLSQLSQSISFSHARNNRLDPQKTFPLSDL